MIRYRRTPLLLITTYERLNIKLKIFYVILKLILYVKLNAFKILQYLSYNDTSLICDNSVTSQNL